MMYDTHVRTHTHTHTHTHALLALNLLPSHIELINHSLPVVCINDKHTHVLCQQLAGIANVDSRFWESKRGGKKEKESKGGGKERRRKVREGEKREEGKQGRGKREAKESKREGKREKESKRGGNKGTQEDTLSTN